MATMNTRLEPVTHTTGPQVGPNQAFDWLCSHSTQAALSTSSFSSLTAPNIGPTPLVAQGAAAVRTAPAGTPASREALIRTPFARTGWPAETPRACRVRAFIRAAGVRA